MNFNAKPTPALALVCGCCSGNGIRESSEDVSHQEELYSPQDVHGSSVRGPQVETDPNCTTKLWAQGAGDHVVGASSCKALTRERALTKSLNKQEMLPVK